MLKYLKAFGLIISLPVIALTIVILINYLNAPDINDTDQNLEDAIHHLNFLEDQLKNHGLGSRMQAQFPEGFVFIHVLYGLSWTEIANSLQIDTTVLYRAIEESKYAYRQISSEFATEQFSATLQPEFGIFYRGWSNYLLGKILMSENYKDSNQVAVFKHNCEDIARSISDSTLIFPESHYQGCWPADAFVGVASLKMHDRIFPPMYESLIANWVTHVKSKVDPATGMIPHAVDCRTGEKIEASRGSSMSLSLIFLHDIDSSFAYEQFRLFNIHFRINRVGFPAIREFLPTQDDEADYDSGPVLWDISFPGSIVSIGAFKKFGDIKTANSLFSTVEAFGVPTTFKKRKKYLFGKQPMADAFLVWARMQY